MKKSDTSVLKGIADDPHLTREMAALQQRAYETLLGMIDNVARELAGAAPGPEPTQQSQDILVLRAQAQQRQKKAAADRKDAENLILASLHNLDNPGWDPADPSTYSTEEKPLLLQVLQWQCGS